MAGARDERSGVVLSVNVGRAREVEHNGRVITTAIWKSPVESRIPLRGVNLAGDEQADRKVHGGYDKAVYAYSRQDYEWWERELGRPLGPGSFGENLTLSRIDVNGALVGERWRIGTAELEVSEPRVPCFKLGLRMGDRRFPKRFAAANRPGTYLRIIEEGEVGAGDEVRVVSRPEHDVSVALVSHAYLHDHGEAARLVEIPQLSDAWRGWATGAVERGVGRREGVPAESPSA